MPPLDLILGAVYHLILPAFVIAALVMALATWRDGAKRGPASAALGLIAATALGPALGHWLHETIAPALAENDPTSNLGYWIGEALRLMPGDSSWNRLPWATLAALCVGRLTHSAETLSLDAWLVRGATSFAIAWWVLPERTLEDGAWIAPAFAAAILCKWMLLECLASKPADGSVPFCLFGCFFVASIVILQASNARASETSIVIGSAFAGLALTAYVRGADASGATPAAAVLLPGLLLVAQQETSEAIPFTAYLAAALAPLVLVFALPFRQWHAFWQLAIRLVLIAIPLVLAIALAMQAGPLRFE